MQISWLFASLLVPLFWGLTNVFDQILQRNYAKDELNLTLASALSRLPEALLLFLMFGFFLPSVPVLLLSFLHCMILTISIFFYCRALQHEEATRVIIFFQTIPVFVFVLSSLFLGEVLTLVQFLAFFTLLFAGFLSLYRGDISVGKFSPALRAVLIFSLLSAVNDVLLKYVLQFFPSGELMLPWSVLGGFLALIPLSFFSFVRKRFTAQNFSWFRSGWHVFLLSLVFGVGGFYFFFDAAHKGSISLTSVFIGIQPLFTSFFLFFAGRFFSDVPKENFRGRVLLFKVLAFVLSLIGLWLINR